MLNAVTTLTLPKLKKNVSCSYYIKKIVKGLLKTKMLRLSIICKEKTTCRAFSSTHTHTHMTTMQVSCVISTFEKV